MERRYGSLHEEYKGQKFKQEFYTEQLIAAAVSKPVLAEAAAELTFDPYTPHKGLSLFQKKTSKFKRNQYTLSLETLSKDGNIVVKKPESLNRRNVSNIIQGAQWNTKIF